METSTQTLHRLTSYRPGREWTEPVDDPRVVQDLQTNDLDRLPWFFKRYPESLRREALPRDWPSTNPSAIAVLAGRAEIAPSEMDPSQLSRVLHLSAGIVRTSERSYGTHFFRAAGSAGGRFPLELYVAVPSGTLLPAGVFSYDPLEHALVKVAPPPHGVSPAIIVTGVPWRTGWRYAERGYRHIYWDAGTMLSQMLASADSAGLTAQLYTVFPDAAVARLVGADGVHEWPVAVVVLGEGAPSLEATGEAAVGEVDAAPLEFPLITKAQRAGERDTYGLPWVRGAPVDDPVEGADSVDTVVLARGSQRRMDPKKGLPRPVLRTCLAAALRGIALPHRIAVHNVEDMRPGIYRWPDLSDPVRAEDLRDELYKVCMEQELGSDAAFVVISATDVSALDDREYRDAQLGAGLVEGRLHLLAYALGASASGMTFYDSEVPAVLGEDMDALLFTCVGVPEYKSSAGGMPGRPTAVRMVTPRLGQ